MSNEKGNGGGGEWEENTPAKPARMPSDRSTCLADLALALNSVAQHCAEASRIVDGMGQPARAAYLYDIGHRLGDLGDLAHEARRLMKDLGE